MYIHTVHTYYTVLGCEPCRMSSPELRSPGQRSKYCVLCTVYCVLCTVYRARSTPYCTICPLSLTREWRCREVECLGLLHGDWWSEFDTIIILLLLLLFIVESLWTSARSVKV